MTPGMILDRVALVVTKPEIVVRGFLYGRTLRSMTAAELEAERAATAVAYERARDRLWTGRQALRIWWVLEVEQSRWRQQQREMRRRLR